MKKLTNKKGFTLMEMLIVVAIIAILVAIAIPTFSGALNKARAATDVANIRAGYAAAQVIALTENAAGTYTLLEDGNVATGTVTNAYACKGAADNAATGTKIGGKVAVTTIAWDANDNITYTVTAGTGDGLGSVTAIGKVAH